jgi:Fe-S-cluster containining protein
MHDLPLLKATFRTCGQRLQRTAVIGGGGGWEDLYTVVDYAAFALSRELPELPCRAGCAGCCRSKALFQVTRREWELVLEAIDAWPEVRRAELARRVVAAHGPDREALESLSAAWKEAGLGARIPVPETLRDGCPLLGDDDLCMAYEARPLVCRAYGAFSVTLDDRPKVMICREFGPDFLQVLHDTDMPELPLPVYERYVSRLGALQPPGPLRPMALWLLEWASARQGAPQV